MTKANEQQKRDSLNEVLKELSKSQDILKKPENRASFFKSLEDIYYNCGKENFRHYYSDIFSTLTLIDGDSAMGSLDILAQNIQTIKDEYVPQNKDENESIIDISKEIAKLYDHTNLDIARINYTKTMTNETRSELAKNKRVVSGLNDQMQKSYSSLKQYSEKTVDEIQKKQESMQKEYITILGIFASIVLAFTGGMTFSTSVLNNIHKVSVYKLGIISLIIGLVFADILWLLMDFIKSINGNQKRRFLYIVLFNILIIVLMVVIVCIYYAINK